LRAAGAALKGAPDHAHDCIGLAVVLALCACKQTAQTAARDEISYGVTGVAATDTLAIRAAPNAAANVVGAIPHDGAGIVATGAATTPDGWSEVVYQGKRGWVNARFLGLGTDPGTRLPALLECMGAEPFWRIALSPGAARADLLFAERVYDYRLTRAASAAGRSGIWLIKGAGPQTEMTLIVRRQSCSDGMSDIAYPYSALALVPGADLIEGCCRPHQPR
jgi:uncharacterized membrane protein